MSRRIQLQPLLGFHALVLCLLLLAPGTVSTGSHSPLFIGLPILRSIAKRQTSEVFQTRRPSLLGRSWDFHNMKYNRKRPFFGSLQAKASTFSFWDSANSTSNNFAYEQRMLRLEERILKLEGLLARKYDGKTPPTYTPMIFPYGEQLLLACTFAGGIAGMLIAAATLKRSLYIGAVSGAVAGVFLYNKEGNFGECIRTLGKVVLFGWSRLVYFYQEMKFNFKAWRVYEKSFKKIELLDKDLKFSENIKKFDRQHGISDKINDASMNALAWWRALEQSAQEQLKLMQNQKNLQDQQQALQQQQQTVAKSSRSQGMDGVFTSTTTQKRSGPVPQAKAPSASPSYTTGEAPNTLGGITEIFNTIHNSYWGTSKSQKVQSPTNETQENMHSGFIEG